MSTKALTIIFFALMLSAAAMASEQQRRIEIIELNFDDMDIHGIHEIQIVEEEVDVTN